MGEETSNTNTAKVPAKKKAAKKAPAKKVAAKKAPAAATGKKGRTSAYAGKKIYRNQKENPHRAGTKAFDTFAAIKEGIKYETFREATGPAGRLHLANLINAGLVRVE